MKFFPNVSLIPFRFEDRCIENLYIGLLININCKKKDLMNLLMSKKTETTDLT